MIVETKPDASQVIRPFLELLKQRGWYVRLPFNILFTEVTVIRS